ncbi:hypothetical protein N9U39_02515, partial [Candidatus Pelagibacter sp.]|nr:hypothetical protein [Candidatus Pelagibacter sp.]
DDQGDWVRGHTWNKDGSKLFVMNWDGGLAGDALASYRVISYDLSTPFNTSTISNAAPTSSTKTSTCSKIILIFNLSFIIN